MNEIKNLKPFPKFCCSIGYIPTSYKISMTYEEQLLWLCDFLENTVIPTVNQNGHAVEELQNLYVELKHYVDDYFSNLDVQTEINNKLDEMAEAGTLTELITDYLNLKCILAYNTISDMANATNLIDGSYVKTYGRNTLNDGGGAFYYIREIQNTDVVDGVNVVALSDPDLVAIKTIDNENQKILSHIIDSSIIGQIHTVDLSKGCQSFTMIDNAIFGAGSGSESNTGFIVKINPTTGERISVANNLNIGHANGMCYCDKDENLYIACSGGSNGISQVSVFDTSLQFVKNIDFTSIGSAWGIAYNSSKEVFYVLSGNQILEMDSSLENIINSKSMETSDMIITGQSIYCDNNYIFYVYNVSNNINPYEGFNRVDVYNANTLEYVMTQKISITGEIEGGYIYNGYSYFMRLTQNRGIIYKGSNYENNKILNYVDNNIIFNKIFSVNGANYNIYVNPLNTNFYADGSENHPFSNIWTAQVLAYNVPTNNVIINLTGDSGEFDLNFRHFQQNLQIKGTDSSNLAKIGGINIQSANNVLIQNIEVVKRTGSFNNLITAGNVKLLELSNVKFNGQGTEASALYASNTYVKASGINVASTFTNNGNAFKLEDGASLFMSGVYIASNANIGVSANTKGNVHLPYQFPVKMANYNTDWNTNIIGGNVTFNIKDIALPGSYRVEASNTISDAPTGYTDNPARFSVNFFADVYYYTFSPINTNKLFVGIKSGTQSSITWTEVI